MRRPSRPTIIPPALSDLDPAAATSTALPALLHVYIDDTPATSPPLQQRADVELSAALSRNCRSWSTAERPHYAQNPSS